MDRSHMEFLHNEESFIDDDFSQSNLDQTKHIENSPDKLNAKTSNNSLIEETIDPDRKGRNSSIQPSPPKGNSRKKLNRKVTPEVVFADPEKNNSSTNDKAHFYDQEQNTHSHADTFYA